MQKPAIELKAIQTSAFASEETHCYDAKLYVDGVLWGSVGNEGHGGPDHFHGVNGKTYDDLNALDARIKATYPQQDVGYLYGADAKPGEHMMEESLETLCGEIVNTHLMAKDLKRSLGRKFMFTKPGQPGIFEVSLTQKGKKFAPDQIKAVFETKQPGIVALNCIPFDEALRIFRADARA